MRERAQPPDDISPHEFFTVWVPRTVAEDADRRARLGDTRASLVFVLTEAETELEPAGQGAAAGEFTLTIAEGLVRGEPGRAGAGDLEVRVDVATWRALNRGDLSAPEALLKRRVRISGDLVLALKLHLILG